MKITKNNLNYVLFENHNARLLIEDVVTHTSAELYYYHEKEMSEAEALRIWYAANEADGVRVRGLRRVPAQRTHLMNAAYC